ncbi:kinase-like domain-containing protein [Baffinella frigidus]|nr:kinase-like domain-containing protein [Cryptophyta sp. CCMP2293]
MDCLAREVVIHGRCRHPNIPLLYGYYEDKSHVFMVLEYIEGKELRQMMSERRTIPEDESLLIYLQMMRALEYIHAQGYIHRDVKPQNVMVKPSGRALIIDFGLSIDSEQGPSEHEEGAGVGTMGFFAPEMVKSNHISAKQDVWASGVILYEMVFGFVPFLPHDLLSDDGVEFPEACWGLEASPALQDVLTKVLCKTHAGRPSSWEALQLAWFTPGAATAVDALIAMEESVAGARFDERAASWDESRRVAFEALSYRVAEQGHLSVTTRTIAISTPQVRPGYYFDAGQPPPFMRDMSDSTVG